MTRVALTAAAALVLLVAGISRAASVAGTVRVNDRAARDAVVYLERADGPAPRPEPRHVVMDQKNLAFVPRVLVVVEGTTVDFTNSDDIQHNVFSPSRAAGAFDLGSYSRGEARSVTMGQAGDVLVLCNIHMEMEAHIVVVRDPFFALTDAEGRYQIADVPPGRYTVKVWRSHWLPSERSLEVTDAAAITLDVTP